MHPESLPGDGEPRDWARAIGPDTFDELRKLAFESKSEPTKLGAIREILDRGYGRTPLASNGAPEDISLDVKRTAICEDDPSRAMPDPSRR